jgi:hypothetical protein
MTARSFSPSAAVRQRLPYPAIDTGAKAEFIAGTGVEGKSPRGWADGPRAAPGTRNELRTVAA